MDDVNSVALSGRLTRDAEVSYSRAGGAVVSFGIATNERRRNQQTGNWEDYTNFIPCVWFGNYAEAVARSLEKGTQVFLSGRLSYSSWEKSGQKRSRIQVIVDGLTIGLKPQSQKGAGQGQTQDYTQYYAQASAGEQVPSIALDYGLAQDDEEIPF